MPSPEQWMIRPATHSDIASWFALRIILWPESDVPQERDYMLGMLNDEKQQVFLAVRPDGKIIGFVEARLREYADGCESSPVGYIEGWFVAEDWRQRGVGADLVRTAELWAKERGCSEMASDCLLDNETSLQAHLKLGYEEVERVIQFRKGL